MFELWNKQNSGIKRLLIVLSVPLAYFASPIFLSQLVIFLEIFGKEPWAIWTALMYPLGWFINWIPLLSILWIIDGFKKKQ